MVSAADLSPDIKTTQDAEGMLYWMCTVLQYAPIASAPGWLTCIGQPELYSVQQSRRACGIRSLIRSATTASHGWLSRSAVSAPYLCIFRILLLHVDRGGRGISHPPSLQHPQRGSRSWIVPISARQRGVYTQQHCSVPRNSGQPGLRPATKGGSRRHHRIDNGADKARTVGRRTYLQE